MLFVKIREMTGSKECRQAEVKGGRGGGGGKKKTIYFGGGVKKKYHLTVKVTQSLGT